MTVGLVLTGGGARGAYQAGILKGISEVLGTSEKNLFPIIVGSSAGAINGAFIASKANDFHHAIVELESMWLDARTSWMFDLNMSTSLGIGLRFIKDLFTSFTRNDYNPTGLRFLIETNPLKEFLRQHIDFQSIHSNIQRGHLESLVIAATHYSTASTVHFLETNQNVKGMEALQKKSSKNHDHPRSHHRLQCHSVLFCASHY